MVGPCPCGMFPCHGGYQCCSWTPPPAPSSHLYTPYDDAGEYYSANDYSSPSVDCTLSLGTPATRRDAASDTQERRRSNFCGWDFFQSKHSSSSSSSSASKKSSSHRSGNSSSHGSGSSGAGADPLLARRCTNCDTTSTPLWRNGPRGPKSLCNACGIRYKKEERRASAAAASNAAYGGAGGTMDSHVAAGGGYYNGAWNQYQPENVQYFLHVHDFNH